MCSSTGSEVRERKRLLPRLSDPIWQSIIIGAVALFIEIIIRRPPGLLGIAGGPDVYWAQHWARNYSTGFQRRALLGEMQSLFYIDSSDYRMITMFSWASSLALYVTIVAAILKVLGEIHAPIRSALLAIVLISPATTGLIVETTGDPLQILLAVYFGLIFFVFGCWREPLSNSAIAVTIFGGFGIASTLVHEASLFFTLPCTLIIAFWRKSKPASGALISHSLGAGLTVGFVLWATERPDAVSSIPLIHIGSESIVGAGGFLASSFSSLLAQETSRLFGQGVCGYFAWSSTLSSSLLLPIFLIYLFISACGASGAGTRLRSAVLLLIIAAAPASLASDISVLTIGYLACFFLLPAVLSFRVITYCVVNRTSKVRCYRLCPIFAALVLFSTPLYVIAGDWGRFLSYSFVSSMILCSMSPDTSRLKLPPISTPSISPLIGAGLIIAGLTATPLLDSYRWQGLKQVMPIFVVASVIIAIVLLVKELDYWDRWQAGGDGDGIEERAK
jgi:hypothetical protein